MENVILNPQLSELRSSCARNIVEQTFDSEEVKKPYVIPMGLDLKNDYMAILENDYNPKLHPGVCYKLDEFLTYEFLKFKDTEVKRNYIKSLSKCVNNKLLPEFRDAMEEMAINEETIFNIFQSAREGSNEYHQQKRAFEKILYYNYVLDSNSKKLPEDSLSAARQVLKSYGVKFNEFYMIPGRELALEGAKFFAKKFAYTGLVGSFIAAGFLSPLAFKEHVKRTLAEKGVGSCLILGKLTERAYTETENTTTRLGFTAQFAAPLALGYWEARLGAEDTAEDMCNDAMELMGVVNDYPVDTNFNLDKTINPANEFQVVTKDKIFAEAKGEVHKGLIMTGEIIHNSDFGSEYGYAEIILPKEYDPLTIQVNEFGFGVIHADDGSIYWLIPGWDTKEVQDFLIKYGASSGAGGTKESPLKILPGFKLEPLKNTKAVPINYEIASTDRLDVINYLEEEGMDDSDFQLLNINSVNGANQPGSMVFIGRDGTTFEGEEFVNGEIDNEASYVVVDTSGQLNLVTGYEARLMYSEGEIQVAVNPTWNFIKNGRSITDESNPEWVLHRSQMLGSALVSITDGRAFPYWSSSGIIKFTGGGVYSLNSGIPFAALDSDLYVMMMNSLRNELGDIQHYVAGDLHLQNYQPVFDKYSDSKLNKPREEWLKTGSHDDAFSVILISE